MRLRDVGPSQMAAPCGRQWDAPETGRRVQCALRLRGVEAQQTTGQATDHIWYGGNVS